MQGADYPTVLDRPYVQKEGLNYIGRNHMGHNYIRFVQKEVRWTQQYDKPSAFFFSASRSLVETANAEDPRVDPKVPKDASPRDIFATPPSDSILAPRRSPSARTEDSPKTGRPGLGPIIVVFEKEGDRPRFFDYGRAAAERRVFF